MGGFIVNKNNKKKIIKEENIEKKEDVKISEFSVNIESVEERPGVGYEIFGTDPEE